MANDWLNYQHLYYFRAIAKEGSIAKASSRLRLGQPTLSTQLKRFEEQLGVTLFERHHKKLTLTENGRVALEYADEIFRMGGEMVEALHDRRRPSRIDVKFGSLDGVPKAVALALSQAAKKLGNCSLSILEGKGTDLFKDLSNYRIDLVLSNFLPGAGETAGLFSRKIARLPVVICGAPKFKSLRSGFPHSIDGKPFILPTQHSRLRYDLDQYFRTHQIRFERVAEVQDISLQLLMGASGAGLLPATEAAASGFIKQGRLVVLGSLPEVFEEIFLVAASRRIENPISSRLMKGFKFSQ